MFLLQLNGKKNISHIQQHFQSIVNTDNNEKNKYKNAFLKSLLSRILFIINQKSWSFTKNYVNQFLLKLPELMTKVLVTGSQLAIGLPNKKEDKGGKATIIITEIQNSTSGLLEMKTTSTSTSTALTIIKYRSQLFYQKLSVENDLWINIYALLKYLCQIQNII